MPRLSPEEVSKVPSVDFMFREDGEFVARSTEELFGGKRVVLFALPGAFTPTCSAYQLPGYEAFYDMFREQGIDEVFCLSVNDAFVMNAWGKDQGIEKVKLIPDGNGEFTSYMGLLVKKFNLGFASRSWRYAWWSMIWLLNKSLQKMESVTTWMKIPMSGQLQKNY